jgi:L-ascorbate metabolism protein UlaG (beta-lactamase superfamily)
MARGSRVGLRPDRALRFRAAPGDWLYDGHGGAFASIGRGATLTSGFVPLYLSLLFGVGVSDWSSLLKTVLDDLEALSPPERDAYIEQRRPKKSLESVAEIALLAYPDVERYVVRAEGAAAPFVLREASLWQPNVELAALERVSPDAPPIVIAGGSVPFDGDLRLRLKRVLARAGSGRYALGEIAGDRREAELVSALSDADVLGDARPSPSHVAPGLYLLGHSALLVRGTTAGLLVDPVVGSQISMYERAFSTETFGCAADAVALTHGHYDHYHLPTLLQLHDRTFLLPPVPRASIVGEDPAARLSSFGIEDVRTPAWGTEVDIGDLHVHVLPFYGEQFLTSGIYAEARNWGSCYVAEAAGKRVLIAADAGFEPAHSVIEATAVWVEKNGPIDIVAAQAVALRTMLGTGDHDVQIAGLTSARHAPDALALLRPEARITLDVDDLGPLCRAARARTFVLYGGFNFERGSSRPELLEKAVKALSRDAPEVTVVPLAIGEGLGFRDGSVVTLGQS